MLRECCCLNTGAFPGWWTSVNRLIPHISVALRLAVYFEGYLFNMNLYIRGKISNARIPLILAWSCIILWPSAIAWRDIVYPNPTVQLDLHKPFHTLEILYLFPYPWTDYFEASAAENSIHLGKWFLVMRNTWPDHLNQPRITTFSWEFTPRPSISRLTSN